MEEPIIIYTEASPNPSSLKFVVNKVLVTKLSSYDFPEPKTAENAPLVNALSEQFDFITRVFVSNYFVTITKNDSVDWFEVNTSIRDFLKQYIESGNVIVDEENIKVEQPVSPEATEGDIEVKIVSILEEYVKPAVEQDGGAISFHSFDENSGLVKVLLQGSCSGCPSSTMTLKSGIENLLTRMVPEVNTVEAEGV